MKNTKQYRSVKKQYITCCSTGDTNGVKNLILKYSSILSLTNGSNSNYKNGLYYAVRNLKMDTTIFLLYHGLKLDNKDIRDLIHDWKASIESYKFLKEIGTIIYELDCFPMPYNEWLIYYYKSYCFSHNVLGSYYSIMRIEKIYNKENLEKLLLEYKKYSSSDKYISSLRDLQLRILL